MDDFDTTFARALKVEQAYEIALAIAKLERQWAAYKRRWKQAQPAAQLVIGEDVPTAAAPPGG